jgi:hypothetical protein
MPTITNFTDSRTTYTKFVTLAKNAVLSSWL